MRYGLSVICIVILLAVNAWGHNTPEIRNRTETHKHNQDSTMHWHEEIDGAGVTGWDHCIAASYNVKMDSYNWEAGPCEDPPRPKSRTSRTSAPRTPTPTVRTSPEEIPEMLDEVVESESEVEIEVPPVEVKPEPVELSRFEIQFWQGWTLMCFPVLPEGVSTVADLYDEWTFFASHNGQIVLLVDGCWVTYSGDRADTSGAIPLSAITGLAVRLDWAAWLGVRGLLLPVPDVMQLQAGVNLLGLPRLPVGAVKPSDLLSDAICAVMLERKGEFYLVARAGDPGDEFPLVVGQAVMLISLSPVDIRFNALEAVENVAVGGWGNLKTTVGD